jgi:hypothetical protein
MPQIENITQMAQVIVLQEIIQRAHYRQDKELPRG